MSKPPVTPDQMANLTVEQIANLGGPETDRAFLERQKLYTIPDMLSGEPRIKELEVELAKANRYLNNVIAQCNVYLPLRQSIVKHLEKHK